MEERRPFELGVAGMALCIKGLFTNALPLLRKSSMPENSSAAVARARLLGTSSEGASS